MTSRSNGALLLSLLPLLAAGALLAGCSRSEVDAEEKDEAQTKVVNVEVTPVRASTYEDYVRITGVLKADHDAVVSAEEAGSILRFYKERGALLAEGEPIAKIDDRELSAAVREAEADSSLRAEQYTRQRRLWEEDHVGSEITFLQAKHTAEQSAARLAGLRTRLAKTVIRAPFPGVLEEKRVEEGEMVAPGTPAARILDTSHLKVLAGVPERFAPDIHPGSRVYITFDVFPDSEAVGEVNFVGRAVDSQARTFPVEVRLANPLGWLKPEMVANLRLVRERYQDAIVVPQQAIRRTEDGYVVFVVAEDADGARAEERVVQLGSSFANRAVIERGLQVGDRLITVGQHSVVSGSRVNVVNDVQLEGSET
jgi:RND family efflux transporter MFP subunit